MKTFALWFGRVLTFLGFATAMGVAILFFVRGPFLAGIAMLVLAILLGFFVWWDIRRVFFAPKS